MSEITRQIRLDIAYKGVNYHGWQRYYDLPTIQGKIETALEKIVGRKEDGLQIWTTGSSRTDAGVHAINQVATFNIESTIPAERFAYALNAKLPHDIRVRQSTEVALDFHPIKDCVRKKYCYLISDSQILLPFFHNYVWDWRSGQLNDEVMHEAAQMLVGEHDFISFQSCGSPRLTTVRTIFNISVQRKEFPIPFGVAFPGVTSPLIVIEVEGSGFLYHMVRAIAGTLADVGKKFTIDDAKEHIQSVLDAKNRSAAGMTAPAIGLYLVSIEFRQSTELERI
ncbi:MAG: tRNA pseudouridine(38-40) synthase TruA [Planctomycetaceae bacterium]|jgi:tRNA pseudouridine38-40 synthase|nr:tRNA pseudouridine(38-40) synthase TruA [Planctomycetaceae bacterium]